MNTQTLFLSGFDNDSNILDSFKMESFNPLTYTVPSLTSDEEVETNEAFTNTSLSGSLSSLSGEQETLLCSLCNESYNSPPRILSCLHVFCENCLSTKVQDDSNGHKCITCPNCKQVTKVAIQGASSLPCDYVKMNITEILTIKKNSSIICTSCKTNEIAVARCADCPHFLCSNCNSAHKVMRCFEGHRVSTLEDLKQSQEKVLIHNPVKCETHKQLVQLYCKTCQETICNDCTYSDHKSPTHSFTTLDSAFLKEKTNLETLMMEGKVKLDACDEYNTILESALSELQSQHDNAKDLIKETYQSYKAVLEKQRDKLLKDLSQLHTKQELKVMDIFKEIEKNTDHLQVATNFTKQLLENGSKSEVLTLKRIISNQFRSTITAISKKPEVTISLEFVTNYDKFQQAVQNTFGQMNDPDNPIVQENTCLDSELRQCVNLDAGLGLTIGMNGGPVSGSVHSSPITSSPLSMPSSFDGDNIHYNSVPIPPTSGPLDGLTSLGEMNLARLASMVPSDVPSTLSMGLADTTIATPFLYDTDTSNYFQNIQALATLGQLDGGLADGFTGLGGLNGLNNLNGLTSSFSSSSLDTPNMGFSRMNGNGSSYDGSSSYYRSHSDWNGNDNGMDRNNHYGSYNRSTHRTVPMEIHFKFGQLGSSICQFSSPHGFCIGENDMIFVADSNNHRIQVFNKDGEFLSQFGTAGKQDGQLWYPRKVEIYSGDRVLVCDRGSDRSRIQLFTMDGIFIRKLRLKLDRHNRYVDIVSGMTVTERGEIVIVDSVQPAMYKLDEFGLTGFWVDCSKLMSEPSDVTYKDGRYFVCDFKGHCVCVFDENGDFVTKIGGQGLTDYPNGIYVLHNNTILIGDSHGNKFHICLFSIDGTLICEYECPYVKVSRCCGLKMTSTGHIITVAKNNHHVLVLNSPFIDG